MRKLASIQTVNAVEPIPNADAIEKIRVLGWWVVVKKGEHQPGDKLVYFEIDSLLLDHPDMLRILDDLGLESVPQLGQIVLGHSVDGLVAFAEGPSVVNPKIQREGVVLRPLAEEYDQDIGGRLSFKVINPRFLLKYDE
jgi:hypothetical protein